MRKTTSGAGSQQAERRKKIGEFLVEQGILETQELEELADQQRRDTSAAPKRLVSLAVEQGIMDRPTAAKVLGQYFGLPGVVLKDRTFDPNLVPLLTLEMMYEGRYVPLDATDRFIFVAMSNPDDMETISWIELSTSKRVRAMVALDDDILQAVRAKMEEKAREELGMGSAGFSFDSEVLIRARIPGATPPAPTQKGDKPPPAPSPIEASAPVESIQIEEPPKDKGAKAVRVAPLPPESEIEVEIDIEMTPVARPQPAAKSPDVTVLQEALTAANERIASLEYRMQLLELVVAQVMEHLSQEEGA
ncbi:MAG: hypothetical protein COX57_11460 [Alphaproteobacteria bacterium CG_4_10_14_0_2_um_filter_63_37]|nr:MAG: hypothetical protein AUJ55_03120 [Proteobacteria bacterium CG1_02_64_396]PJA23913.1 MAG: hypothetical protein COX57_11460 [Alphaproteobacteria bacterium CG_4_10_14_0_2_um_filter_63_37]